ncbi:MAG: prephenate dehydrogenase/arogenate dehydrogenase family protein [Oscillospiraceae bacterium]
MNIGIIGLGIIGGSFAKAIRKRTAHTCLGTDTNPAAVEKALEQEAISDVITEENLSELDFVIVSLYPRGAVDYLLSHATLFKKGAIVIDVCGVKQFIVGAVSAALAQAGVRFVSCHPMAGREYSGFDFAVDNLFDGASFIITPDESTDPAAAEIVREFALSLGFHKVVSASPAEHDRIIAYTSQLAHVVSSAYIKNPTVERQAGFSAGSFKDMTRVARLNEEMWTELFLLNRDSLLTELDCLLASLGEYRAALAGGDGEALRTLLAKGRAMKELSDRNLMK